MSIVTCAICGKGVQTTAQNYVYANGIHQHKKCKKKPVLTPEEVADRKSLFETIEWCSVKKNLSKYGLNWTIISSQSERLRQQGYSYKDQEYALKWVVEKDGGYWGFGRVEKFMSHAMEQKKREEEFSQKEKEKEQETKKESTLKVTSKPNFMNF